MAGSLKRNPNIFLTRILNSATSFRCLRSLQTLAYEEITIPEEEKRPKELTAFVLHGLLGSGRNWRSFSRNLASSLSNSSSSSSWRMVLVDLRNHGRSAELEGLDPPHDLDNAANDLANLVKTQGWTSPDVVIGHSLGGKIALQYVESCSRGDYGDSVLLPKQLWVLDSVPGEVKHEDSDGEVEKVLKTLQSLPSSVPSRKWLVNHMMELGFSKSLSEWIGSNLKKSGDHETWAFNLDDFPDFQLWLKLSRQKTYWSLLEQLPADMEIAIVRAEKSDRWDPNTIQRLDTLPSRTDNGSQGKVSVHTLPKAGHWVHVDNPKGLLDIVAPKMESM